MEMLTYHIQIKLRYCGFCRWLSSLLDISSSGSDFYVLDISLSDLYSKLQIQAQRLKKMCSIGSRHAHIESQCLCFYYIRASDELKDKHSYGVILKNSSFKPPDMSSRVPEHTVTVTSSWLCKSSDGHGCNDTVASASCSQEQPGAELVNIWARSQE